MNRNVYHLQCSHCGLLNEKLGRRTVGDYGMKCDGCNQLLRPAATVRPFVQTGHLALRHTPNKGLGVFATQAYKKGDLVERCPAYVIASKTVKGKKINHKVLLKGLEILPYADSNVGQSLAHMVMPWHEDEKTRHSCFVMGYAMLYNHAPPTQSNVGYEGHVDPETQRLYFDITAIRDISPGEEMCHTYNLKDKLWFREG